MTQVGIRCVRLEGSMSMEARDRMISAFTADPGVTVFLMSLKAGGVALNLTAASHVMLMDPWYGPLAQLSRRHTHYLERSSLSKCSPWSPQSEHLSLVVMLASRHE